MAAAAEPTIDPHALKHLSASPIAARKVQLVTQKRNDLIRALAQLELVQMMAQLDKERRGGISSGDDGEQVSRSRSASLPALDAQDRERDRIEREAEKHLNDIGVSIQRLVGLAQVVGSTRSPSKREREQAADIGRNCDDCGRPVACTPADRILSGFCEACSKAWRRAGSPDKPGWIRQRQKQRDTTSA